MQMETKVGVATLKSDKINFKTKAIEKNNTFYSQPGGKIGTILKHSAVMKEELLSTFMPVPGYSTFFQQNCVGINNRRCTV